MNQSMYDLIGKVWKKVSLQIFVWQLLSIPSGLAYKDCLQDAEHLIYTQPHAQIT